MNTTEINLPDRVLQLVIDAMPDCVKLIDPQGRVCWMNEGGRCIMEISDFAAFQGKSWCELWPEESQGIVSDSLQLALAGRPSVFTGECPTALGNLKWWEVIVRPLYSPNGELEWILSISRDISHLKAAEEEVKRLNQGLENLVNERTLELCDANRELQGFVYFVAHDMRTYLRSLSLAGAMISRDVNALDQHTKENLDGLILNAKQASSLVDGLLELTRNRDSSVKKEPCDISNLACNIAGELQCRAWPHNLHFEIEEGLKAETDPQLARIILHNLMENAAKYHARGSSAIVKVVLRDGQFLVCDNGVGFDSRFMEKVFAPFERLHRDDDFPGNGMGLFNAKRLVEKLGGHISAASQPGGGACFTFTLS